LELADGVAADRDKTEVVGLLEVHVDNTTRPDRSHVATVESIDFGETTRRWSVATILGEEDRDRVALKLLSAVSVSRSLVAGLTTPRVDVVSPEVNGAGLVRTAVEVVGHVLANGGIIVGRISNTNGSVVLALNVRLGVTDGSLDESACISVVWSVGDFVASKEAQDVGVRSKGVDDSGVPSVKLVVPLRVITVDGETWSRKVRHNVDAVVVQKLHALGVVGSRVNCIRANDVGTELLENWDIALARGVVCERIDVVIGAVVAAGRGTVARVILLVGDTLQEAAEIVSRVYDREKRKAKRTIGYR